MGIAFKEIEIEGKKFRALVDTGFIGEILISKKAAENLDLKVIEEKERITADNRKIKVKVAVAKVKIDDEEGRMFVEIVEDSPVEVLIGVLALEKLGYIVNPKTGMIEKIGMLLV